MLILCLLSVVLTLQMASAHKPSAMGITASTEAVGSGFISSGSQPRKWRMVGKFSRLRFTSVVPSSFPSASNQLITASEARDQFQEGTLVCGCGFC